MAAPKQRCFICGGDGPVLLCTDTTLIKCRTILNLRKKHALKYDNIIVSAEVNESDGYHSNCYNSFSAVIKKYRDDSTVDLTSQSNSAENITSDQVPSEDVAQQTSNDSVLQPPEVCIFCGKKRKKNKGIEQKLFYSKKSDWNWIHDIARQDNDFLAVLQKIENEEGAALHRLCRVAYLNRMKSAVKTTETSWSVARSNYKQAFEELSIFIEEDIIKSGNSLFFSLLCSMFKEILCRINKSNDSHFGDYDESFDEQHLEDKIKNKYCNKILFITIRRKKVVIPGDGANIDDEIFSSLEEEDILKRAALILRHDILHIKPEKLPADLKVRDIIKGECAMPESIREFYLTLLGGLTRRRRESIYVASKVESLSQDIIYTVSRGQIKTSKHMTLGLALKSLTSSRKVIDILNKFGHCCSYNVIEELETEMTYAATERAQVCPAGIELVPHLSTGVAFDNFDRFVETTNGKDTLHDTVGIIFQFEESTAEGLEDQSATSLTDPQPGTSKSQHDEVNEFVMPDFLKESIRAKRRRSYETISDDLPSYIKKPRMTDRFLSPDDEKRYDIPDNLTTVAQLDTVWMLSHAVKMPNVPMWTGFNSRLLKDNSVKQKISYLTPINDSPTDKAVVLKTMYDSQKIAEECCQKYIQVTYDLAICRIAFQIQSAESSEVQNFNNIFIHLGQFHIEMSYFKAIGKFIDNCGLTHAMVDSDLLASGSVNGFITGKHFNRCKRFHPIVSLGIQILHFEAFLRHEGIKVSEDIKLQLERIYATEDFTVIGQDGPLSDLLAQYSHYKERTLAGEFGRTPQFYILYTKLIDYYHILSRSIRTADFELYRYILPKITNLFFIMNHQNYARWTVKYHDNLLRVDDTHPGLIEEFRKGSFGVKRTDKPFSRQPIDITLEQTINADAGRRLTGVTHFTNSISARQRWARSHSLRSAIISHVYEVTRMTKSQDITADLEPSKMIKQIDCLNKFMSTVEQNMSPFQENLDKKLLFNIATGRAATESTAEFLLNVEEKGNRLRQDFISACHENPARFETAISKNTLNNFNAECVKKKVKINNKVQEVRMQRDLFGRMLGISIEHHIDIAKVMKFPLTPVPMSMCHLDGQICKTAKSVLVKIFEKKIETPSPSPPPIDIIIVDGFFMLHLMKDIPKTFGSISKKFLTLVTKSDAQKIDVIFDQYFTPSIKDEERSSRDGFQGINYTITGADQARPADFIKELRNTKFKEALVNFFTEHWATEEMIPYIGNKTIHLNQKSCYSYNVFAQNVVRTRQEELECSHHEEADTKIVFHVSQINSAHNILIKCSDTDVLVILLGNMDHWCSTMDIWMEIGSANSLRNIHVREMYDTLGGPLCKALPGFHALTGCDYNPSFYRKGKAAPFKILEKSREFQTAFASLGDISSEQETAETFKILEKFVCRIYGIKSIDNVDEARLFRFSTKYKPSQNEKFMKNLKNYDASNLPPCKAELHQQLLRSRYITSIWNNAHLKIPSALKPEGNGWIEEESAYQFVWFEGDQLPELTSDVIIQPDETNYDDEISSEDHRQCESDYDSDIDNDGLEEDYDN